MKEIWNDCKDVLRPFIIMAVVFLCFGAFKLAEHIDFLALLVKIGIPVK